MKFLKHLALIQLITLIISECNIFSTKISRISKIQLNEFVEEKSRLQDLTYLANTQSNRTNLGKEFDEIFRDLNYKAELDTTPKGVLDLMRTFINNFISCDINNDNLLSLEEFVTCIDNDPYMTSIITSSSNYTNFSDNTLPNSTVLYSILFNILENQYVGYLNINDFMILRLLSFSWKECLISGLFIEEINFECAFEIAYGFEKKKLNASTLGRLFSLSLDLSNSGEKLDFITYSIITTSAKLYSKIHSRGYSYITLNDLTLSLENNILPWRYNIDTIQIIFKLIENPDKHNQGIDILNFIFHDFFLRIFYQQSNKVTPYPNPYSHPYTNHLNNLDFKNCLISYLFPQKIFYEIERIEHLNSNSNEIKIFHNFTNLKSYLETDEKIIYINRNKFGGATEAYKGFRFSSKNKKFIGAQNSNTRARSKHNPFGTNKKIFGVKNISSILFKILDDDGDGFINFYDFGTFSQVAYLFNKFDSFNEGRLNTGELNERLTKYSDLPIISILIRERAKIFNLIPKNISIDLYVVLLSLRIEDIIRHFNKRIEDDLYQYQLKNIFNYINFRNVTYHILNKCLNINHSNNINIISLYDWKCAFINGLLSNLSYSENSDSYLTSKSLKILLKNNILRNADHNIE